MKYATMTPEQIERVFAVDVLGWEIKDNVRYYSPEIKDFIYASGFHPLANTDLAMLGVEKLIEEKRAIIQLWHDHSEKWHCIIRIPPKHYQSASDNFNAAIVEACIRIARPDLFKGD